MKNPISGALNRASLKWKNIWEKRAKKKRQAFADAAATFAHEHKDAFIMLCDPATDVMLMGYRNIVVPMRYTDPKTGLGLHIVADALAYSKGKGGDKAVDQFLLAVDSGVVQIANELYNRRRASVSEKVFGKREVKVLEPKENPFKAS